MAYNFDHGSWLNSARHLNGADKQMYFQSTMSSTAHQREIEDLKAAGLNPVLSAGGTGASTPSGAYDQLADIPATSGSGGYRVAKKAVKDANKNTTLAIKDLGSALKESIKLNTAKPSYESQLADISNIKPIMMDSDKALKSGKGLATFNERWNTNQLTFQDLKDYVTSQNNTKWYDTPKYSAASLSNKYVAGSAVNNIGTDFAKNWRSQALAQARKRLSKEARKEFDKWYNANKYGLGNQYYHWTKDDKEDEKKYVK